MADTPNEADSGWQQGQRLVDRYEVIEALQDASTLQLYRLRATDEGKLVLALRPKARLLQREGATKWFDYLARQLMSVPEHNNLLPCERLEYDGDVPIIIMPNVEGPDCATAVATRALTDLSAILNVAHGVAEALAWLHAHGWIHYNVKPANVLLGGQGAVKVFKYGLTGARTRAYASPEQMMSETPLTPATDIWSWAASVLEMFTGGVTWPLGVVVPDALARYREEGPTRIDIPPMPDELADLLDECLQKQIESRPNAAEVVKRLEAISPDAD
ncbi:MAG: protein kinase [Candidatus Brocadiia bacterium]